MCNKQIVAAPNARDTTESRMIGEQSLISAMSFALAVFPEKATNGAKRLLTLVEKANPGVPLYRVQP
jgi:hypothetical protein